MILHHFYDDRLTQASYLVGCAATGEAIIIEPNRESEPYLAVAVVAGQPVSRAVAVAAQGG